MRFWFDTEFLEDGSTIKLISIGVVAEDGREYYAEAPDAWYLASQTAWLVENVRPHLHQYRGNGSGVERGQIASELVKFMGEKPEIWAYYGAYDWVALCQLFGRMIDLPKGWPMFCRDVKQLAWSLGDPKIPEPAFDGAHAALIDARWTREAWKFLMAFCAGRA